MVRQFLPPLRHLNRMFTDSMGFSPKMFSRIVRFQYALYQMRLSTEETISHYLDDLDYADQAHFQREFKEFTGITPCHFQQLMVQ